MGKYSILVAEYLVMREVIVMAIPKNHKRIIIQSNSQLIVNSIYGKIYVSKEIINLVEEIKCYFLY